MRAKDLIQLDNSSCVGAIVNSGTRDGAGPEPEDAGVGDEGTPVEAAIYKRVAVQVNDLEFVVMVLDLWAQQSA